MNAAEANGILTAVLDAFGEDYDVLGRLVHHLQIQVPGVDWETYLTAKVADYQPFVDSGLSIDWWVQTVMDRANSMT